MIRLAALLLASCLLSGCLVSIECGPYIGKSAKGYGVPKGKIGGLFCTRAPVPKWNWKLRR